MTPPLRTIRFRPATCPGDGAHGRARTTVTTVLVALLGSGCSMTTDMPARESVPLPPGFEATSGEALPERWWRHFDDPRLDALMTTAVQESFTLAAAQSRLRQARAAARIQGASRLPTLDGTGEAAVTRQRGENTEQYTGGFAAAYELDLWGRIDAATQAASLESLAVGRDLRAAGITVTAEAATAFYSLLRQRARIDLLQAQRENNRQIAGLIDVRYRNGQAQLDELLRQRRLVEASEAELATARAEAAALRNRLAALLGRSPDALELPGGHEFVEVPAAPALGIPSVWLNRRPDLQAAWLRVRAADAEVAAAIAARYPRLDLTASLRSTSDSPSTLFEDWIQSLAAGLTVPLFRGGALAAEVERNRAARAVAFNEYARTVTEAVAEVGTALSDERYARERLESLDRQVALAEQVVQRLRQRYVNGVVDYLDVLSALTTLQEAQQQRLEARWAVLLRRIDLIRTIAGGWEQTDTAVVEETG
ncbi:TolC family protein [Ectothiorhodospiraceae bacterium WFHF3C12]|nr:TolC family protein [Ectothiorhodospiraceae bacterium WFHF3C12]